MTHELKPCPFCGGNARLMRGSPGCVYVKCDGCQATSDDRFEAVAIAAWNRRALSAAKSEPLAVKALEWRHYPDAFPPMWVSQNAPFGNYSIEEAAGSDCPSYDVLNPTMGVMVNCEGLPEAKAAAQADYESRIRSALASEPANG